MNKRTVWILAATLVALCVAGVGRLIADCAKPTGGLTQGQSASNIKVLAADDGVTVCQGCIDSAAMTWNGSCPSGTKPTFVGASSSADITAFVRFQDGANPGTFDNCSASKCACADVDIDPSNGEITLATIRIWETAPGQDCSANATDSLTHEFAHLLGIDDPPAGCDNCTNIMGSVTGPTDAQVCDQANDNFQTDSETFELPDDGHPCRPQVV
jgi:hypothetical protein